MFERIQAINRRGTTILLVEQDAFLALEISHRAYVLENGTGNPRQARLPVPQGRKQYDVSATDEAWLSTGLSNKPLDPPAETAAGQRRR